MPPLPTSSALRLLARTAPRRLVSSQPPPPPPPPPSPGYIGRIHPTSASASAPHAPGQPHVGPFPLPDVDREAHIRAEARKWRDLGRAEKVARTGSNVGGFFVVVAGAGLVAAVGYSFGSELFAENSPTRVFEDATERVKESHEVQSLIIPPYSFWGHSPGHRLRRHRRPTSLLSADGNHLVVKFWLEGTDPTPQPEESWLAWAKRWAGPAIFDDSHHPGQWQPSPSPSSAERELAARAAQADAAERARAKGWGEWLAGGVKGAMSGLVPRGLSGRPAGAEGGAKGASSGGGLFPRMRRPQLGEFWTGEVTAELRKDPATGHFVYQSLTVDVPDSRHPNHYRVHVPTDVVGEPRSGLDRLRIWTRKATSP